MNGGTLDASIAGWNPIRVGTGPTNGIVILNNGTLITSGLEADWLDSDGGLAEIQLNGGLFRITGAFDAAFRLDDNAEMIDILKPTLIVRGHAAWDPWFVTLCNGTQIVNVDAKVLLLTKE